MLPAFRTYRLPSPPGTDTCTPPRWLAAVLVFVACWHADVASAQQFMQPIQPQPVQQQPRTRGECYWIASARECPQQCPACASSGCLEFYRRECGVLQLTKAAPNEFFAALTPGIPVCMVIHGSFIDWDTFVRDSEASYRWLRSAAPGLPIQFVFYTWPSVEGLTYFAPLDVLILGKRAGRNSFHLGRLITQFPIETPISLVGHSHGTRVASSTLHLLAGGTVEGYDLPQPDDPRRRIRTVFAAAAIDHHWLNPGERYGLALDKTEGLLNLRNSTDLALVIYPLQKPFGYESLGRIGFDSRDQWQQGYRNAKIREIELSPLLGAGHIWARYTDKHELAAAMVPYVYFNDSPTPAMSQHLRAGTAALAGAPAAHAAGVRYAGPAAAPAASQSAGGPLLRFPAPIPATSAPTQHVSHPLPGLNLRDDLPPRR